MNRDEDILFLFITTHGDRDHSLSFELPPLELQQLTAHQMESGGRLGVLLRWLY